MAAVIFWAAWGTRSVIPTLPKLPDSPGIGLVPTLVRVVTDLTSSLRSPSFRWLFGGMMNVYAVSGANAALDLYMFNYFWEIGSTGAMLVFLGYPIGGIIGAFFGPALYARFGKRAGLIFGVLGWAVFQTLPVVLRLLGFFPENGDMILLPLLVTMKALSGATVIQADIAFGSMVADVVDEHELTTEKRQEGIFFAATFFAGKATAGLGSMVAGFTLDLIAWPRGADIQTAADIPAGTILELGIVYGPIFGVFGFLSAWCFSHYRLTRERHAEILAALAARRGAAA
jgi:Na+/melibiose symporter-like transporter